MIGVSLQHYVTRVMKLNRDLLRNVMFCRYFTVLQIYMFGSCEWRWCMWIGVSGCLRQLQRPPVQRYALEAVSHCETEQSTHVGCLLLMWDMISVSEWHEPETKYTVYRIAWGEYSDTVSGTYLDGRTDSETGCYSDSNVFTIWNNNCKTPICHDTERRVHASCLPYNSNHHTGLDSIQSDCLLCPLGAFRHAKRRRNITLHCGVTLQFSCGCFGE